MSGEPENGGSEAEKIVGAVVGFATLVGCVVGFAIFIGWVARMVPAVSKTKADPKMMKAPGRPGQVIDRAGFVNNPGDYFRKLHEK